jgi:adenylate cyclase
MLDLYFESIASIVGARGGIIDNIIADEMVLFFPEAPGNKHCSDCVITAIEICAEWHNIQQKVALNDLPSLSVGIGIHSGVASIGTVGSDIRSNYTCLGDTINTTSRIQKISREHFPKTDSAVIIASKKLFEEAKVPITNVSIENVQIRGKAETINLVQIKQSDAMSFSAFLKNIKDAS